ncbi:hypothetical protein LSTR_LSTR001279 [Laodelphax striatellus]|uniref:Uncharacterized protein n=1 Tax=Laodelphax striatellus TaxID=195883 RepID=A0A482XCT8_LAOST|nr:hypothetical protein LSTR_LSTR001279 [Laodelphax striatellus]
MLQVLRKARSDSSDSKIKLFESLVLPKAVYWEEVWGLACAEQVERVQLGIFKRLLFLSRRTPNWALRMEQEG